MITSTKRKSSKVIINNYTIACVLILGRIYLYKITKIVRARSDCPRGVVAREYANMVV